MRIPLLSRLLPGRTAEPAAAVPTPAAGSVPPIRPVIDRDFPDPDVLTVDATYYAYSTNSVYDGRLVNVPVQSAGALGGPWTMRGDAMPRPAQWVAGPGRGGPNVWAPELSRVGASYLLYYTAHHGAYQVQGIGVAAADSPTGPFRPVGTDALVCRPRDGDTLDADSFVDTDGTRYLIYKSGRVFSTMWLQPLSPDGCTALGERVALFRSDRPEEADIVEAPTLVRHGGRYVLFYSANTFDSGNYFVNYATAAQVRGPYVKAPGRLLTSATLGNAYRNPGHEGVVSTPDGDRLVFHASIGGGARAMFVAGLGWNPDGTPVVEVGPDPAVPA
jgi:beta-xylosidase